MRFQGRPARVFSVGISLVLLLLTAAPAPIPAPAPAALPPGEQPIAAKKETRLRKLHLVRPDLIPYPIAFEVYC